MRIIGISPLDKDSTVCLLEDGKVISACAEERLSRVKMQDGFPRLALRDLMDSHGLEPKDIDKVVYAFHDWPEEQKLIEAAANAFRQRDDQQSEKELFDQFRNLPSHTPAAYGIPGLDERELYMQKGLAHKLAYKALSTVRPLAKAYAERKFNGWVRTAVESHEHWAKELQAGLAEFGLSDKLERVEHHLTHSANAFYMSGFDKALIVTLDGYGSGLGGSVSLGNGSRIERIHSMAYPTSLGEFYERVTSSLGFKPGRHEGKIVGLAAYESPDVLYSAVRSLFKVENGEIRYLLPHNIAFSRHLATTYSKPAVAAAWQKVLEEVVCEYIAHYVKQTGCTKVVLSGGVVANVKANQRIFEIEGVDGIFVHPNMGDGGCCVGAALVASQEESEFEPYRINDVYWGQEYNDDVIEAALAEAGLTGTREDDIELRIASLLADEQIVARFNGRMEYGPRSLGNRSILYHAKDPSVNLWLNQKLQRTEFMPFAPATLYEERDNCYVGMEAGGLHVTLHDGDLQLYRQHASELPSSGSRGRYSTPTAGLGRLQSKFSPRDKGVSPFDGYLVSHQYQLQHA